ncbi:hypothetical protein AMAG_15343 [Allomyces macrogynus ATCC 38327]|uniref:Uncharacterized protein n=1 Tax=Allomyces macrogynus (strain ATCC 38327) TaxID=578462 RepID=A0A0L0T8F4_ALLM3|nr:hypothetical protein AMAG_15343 [Allomyces macrogynus ATCC 38327]|eukprot:KNE71093.1 hypothetical protein AMAG_15343 [Allomyces macrogynus ATCC 38327]
MASPATPHLDAVLAALRVHQDRDLAQPVPLRLLELRREWLRLSLLRHYCRPAAPVPQHDLTSKVMKGAGVLVQAPRAGARDRGAAAASGPAAHGQDATVLYTVSTADVAANPHLTAIPVLNPHASELPPASQRYPMSAIESGLRRQLLDVLEHYAGHEMTSEGQVTATLQQLRADLESRPAPASTTISTNPAVPSTAHAAATTSVATLDLLTTAADHIAALDAAQATEAAYYHAVIDSARAKLALIEKAAVADQYSDAAFRTLSERVVAQLRAKHAAVVEETARVRRQLDAFALGDEFAALVRQLAAVRREMDVVRSEIDRLKS